MSEPIPGTAIDATEATVAALRAALAVGALTAHGLTAFYLSRIERLDPLLHSVITVGDATQISPPSLIVTRLHEQAYAETAAIASVLLLTSLAILVMINVLERWSRRRGT